jgi:hypothetical protein
MSEMLFDAARYIALMAIFGVLALLLGVGIQYLWILIGDKRYAQLKEFAMETVRFLEQVGVIRGMDNAEMKSTAVEAVIDMAELLKIPMGYEGADRLVESLIQIVESEQAAYIAGEIHEIVSEA